MVQKEETIMDTYEERQVYIRDKIYGVNKLLMIISLVLMIATICYRSYGEYGGLDKLSLFAHAEISFSYIVSTIITVLLNYAIWYFSVVALLFSPIAVILLYKASKIHALAGAKGIKLLQVSLPLLVPAFVFSVIWINFGKESNEIILSPGLYDLIYAIAFSVVTAVCLWGTSNFIPLKLSEVRLAIISLVIYGALFITYALGYSIAAVSVLLGIALYIAFNAKAIENLANVTILYDLDHDVALDIILASSLKKKDEASKEVLKVKKQNLHRQKELTTHAIEEQQVLNDKQSIEQLLSIEQAKSNLDMMASQAKRDFMQKKLESVKEVYSILEKERSNKMDKEIPEKIEKLRKNTKDLTPEQLSNHMDALINEMNFGQDYIPKALEKLQTEMDEISKSMNQKKLENSIEPGAENA